MYACHSESWESSWTVWRSWEGTHSLCKLALLGLYYNLSSFNPHQFAYKANRSTEDSIFIILHTVLSHLEHRDRVLFVDCSSACNTIIPNVLV